MDYSYLIWKQLNDKEDEEDDYYMPDYMKKEWEKTYEAMNRLRQKKLEQAKQKNK